MRLLRRWVPASSRRDKIYRWLVYRFKRALYFLRNAYPGSAEKRYARWRAEFEAGMDLTIGDLERSDSQRTKYRFSITLLLLGEDLSVAMASIEAVESQTYPHWKLWLLLQDSHREVAKQWIESLSVDQKRIRTAFLGGEAERFSELVDRVSGDFCILFPSGDTLSPNALWEIASTLHLESDADVLYSDEDKFNIQKEHRQQPWFKPDWSPDLLLSVNYLQPLIVRKSILEESIDNNWPPDAVPNLWDLALRCSDNARKVVHIPKVLYHRSAFPLNADSLPNEGENAVISHLQRRGIEDPRVVQSDRGILRFDWSIRQALVSIIIPTRDNYRFLRKCLAGVLKHTDYRNLEVIVVDNGSVKPETASYYEQLRTDPRVRILTYDEPFNFSKANNLGVKHAHGEHLLFLNDDIEVFDSDWLEELVRWSQRPEIGAVGTKLLFPDGRVQHAGIVLGLGGQAGHVFRDLREGESGLFGSTDWYRNYLAVTGACMMIERRVYDEVGGYNEAYQLAFGDVELCLRIRQHGYRVVYTPFARLIHHESVSRGRYIPTNDLIEGYVDFKALISAGDPYFNPNLSYGNSVPEFGRKVENRIEFLQRIIARRLIVE